MNERMQQQLAMLAGLEQLSSLPKILQLAQFQQEQDNRTRINDRNDQLIAQQIAESQYRMQKPDMAQARFRYDMQRDAAADQRAEREYQTGRTDRAEDMRVKAAESLMDRKWDATKWETDRQSKLASIARSLASADREKLMTQILMDPTFLERVRKTQNPGNQSQFNEAQRQFQMLSQGWQNQQPTY